MKTRILSILISMAAAVNLAQAETAGGKADKIILDETAIRNLRIETVSIEPGDFEETAFALGRIAAMPGRIAAVASRIPGRVTAIAALPGDSIDAGAQILRVESRQPGNPPPVISLTSPIKGMVTELNVRVGDPVEPDRPLAEVCDLAEVFAVARVPEHLAGRIQPGATAHIRIPAIAEGNITGRLLRFGTSADETGGTIDAFFVLPNPQGAIRPGMRVEFSIVLSRRSGVVTVPRSALQGEPASRYVYVKDFDLKNAFIKTPVIVGKENDRFVEIVNGLLPTDEVVTQGAYSLAFVGGGTVSLKAALDAAHGHAHNEDGSEISAGQQKTNAGGQPAAHADHDHEEAHSPFWMIVSGVLFVLLLAVSIRRRTASASADESAAGKPKGE